MDSDPDKRRPRPRGDGVGLRLARDGRRPGRLLRVHGRAPVRGDLGARGSLDRDKRLLLIGLLVGRGMDDVLGLQLEAALGNAELSADTLREIVIFLTHYAGWPSGAKMNSAVETLIAKADQRRRGVVSG